MGRRLLLYTPLNSYRATGTVMLAERPTLPVSPSMYRGLLTKRLRLMMEDEDQDYLEEVLARLETADDLNLPSYTPKAAATIVETSQTLRELAAYPVMPIPPREWQPDPETLEAMQLESAVEYLEMLIR